jgi:Domain of unknown function (DUF4920)
MNGWRNTLGSMAITIAAVAAVSAAGDQKLGPGVKLTTATPIADLYASPAKFVGKTVRVDGIVTEVCEDMGCWMALASDATGEMIVRLKVKDEGPIVFPLTARGKHASAEGVFSKVSPKDHESLDAAAQDAKKHPKAGAFGKLYVINATGAEIK